MPLDGEFYQMTRMYPKLPTGFPHHLPLSILREEFLRSSNKSSYCPVSPSWGDSPKDAFHAFVSMRVAVLYNHTEASNPLDFSTCIFPQEQCAPCPCDHLLASLQDQDPFSDKFCQKCKNCLLTSYHHLPLSVRHSLSLWLSVLTWLFRVPLFILQGSLSGIFQPPVSLRVCVFLRWKGNILVCASSLAAQTD